MTQKRPANRSPQKPPPRELWSPFRMLRVFLVIAVAVGAVVLLNNNDKKNSTATPAPAAASPALGLSSPKPLTPQQQEVQDFEDRADNVDLRGISGDLVVAFVKAMDAFQKGTGTAAAAHAEASTALTDFFTARTAMAKEQGVAVAPEALADYRRGVELYIDSARAALIATSMPAGPLRDQIALSYQRLYRLGDRTFDQAKVVLKPLGPPVDPESGVVVVPPVDVPDFASIGLAPGAPLEAAAASHPAQHYQDSRPQVAISAWVAEVAALKLPSGADVAAAISHGSTAQLKAMAEQLTDAVTTLDGQGDPQGDRVSSTRVRLGLLVDAEAVRDAQAATLATGTTATALRTLAETTVLIGDQMWDPRLGERSTGFPKSLLTSTAADVA